MSVGKVTQTNLTTTEALIICDVPVRQDAEGRYSLNDLHQAAGGESKHQPALFVRRQETADLMGEINSTNSQSLLIEPQTTGMPVVSMEGRHGGTYACKELVYVYAMWISPAFHLKVIRTFDALMTAKATGNPVKTTFEAAKLFRPLFQAVRLMGCDRNAAAISANQAVQTVTGANLLALLGQTHLTAENQQSPWFTPTKLGQRIGVSGHRFNRLLAEAGLQVKQGDEWTPTPNAQGFYRLFDTGKRHGRGTPVTQTKWAEHVLAWVQPMQVSA